MVYSGASNEVSVVRLGDRLGEGIVPPCRDTETFGHGCMGGADETTGGEAVEVFRLPGIPSRGGGRRPPAVRSDRLRGAGLLEYDEERLDLLQSIRAAFLNLVRARNEGAAEIVAVDCDEVGEWVSPDVGSDAASSRR